MVGDTHCKRFDSVNVSVFICEAAFFEYLPKMTIYKRGARTVWVRCSGKSKERATVMLLGCSDGTKAKPFIVFKRSRSTVEGCHKENLRLHHGFGKTLWREIEKHPRNAQTHGNAKVMIQMLFEILFWWYSGY